jgi:K+-transporting ATPase ATPase C chain
MSGVIRQAVAVFIVLTIVTGVAYPLLITLVAQGAFPYQANGSLLVREAAGAAKQDQAEGMVDRYDWARADRSSKPETLIGSALIGQSFTSPRYFWTRPSATAPAPYNAEASTGSNLGPTNPAQLDAVRERVQVTHDANEAESPVPIDLVTASGSGLDPHISPAAADYQVPRIAKARGISQYPIRRVIAEHVEGRTFGILGEPRLNVLELNLALDQMRAGPRSTPQAITRSTGG